MKIIVVSGRSGAGKSVALSVLEDAGYYCVDNIPVNMLTQLVSSLQINKHNIAISIDVRNLPEDNSMIDMLNQLKQDHDVTLLFLHANEATLLKRYSETRRLHPLSMTSEKLSLEQAVKLENERLANIKQEADLMIDSTALSLHDLSESIKTKILHKQKRELLMVFESFGFKYGLPKDADYVFDVRFLPNPHWVPELREYTGLEKPVQDYLAAQPDIPKFINSLQDFMQQWLPLLEKNNRSYVTVAIGCTGGKHRSVYLTQQIGEYFEAQGRQVKIRHTTLEKKS